MLTRVTLSNGVVVYQSRLLNSVGVVHAFSTRIGGVSPVPFESLNLGNPPGAVHDTVENVRRNFGRMLSALKLPDVPVASVRQVHGCDVALLQDQGDGEYSESVAAEIRDRFQGQIAADAIISDVSSAVLAVRIADCAPILLAAENGRLVAAIHAGWRGVVAQVGARTIAEINAMGYQSSQIMAAIGPAIGMEHFEVGPEVAEQFQSLGLNSAVHTIGYTRPHIDLADAIKRQLRQCGVTLIDGGGLCTFINAADFFSHRRDHGITGRMAAIIRPVIP